jgi:two-component system chemotaxis response regulator CheY
MRKELLMNVQGASPPVRTTPTPKHDVATYRMMVADDNHHARGMIRRSVVDNALRDAGIVLDVIEVSDGVAAWARLKVGDIDLLFVERDLPGMDGLSLLRRVRQTPGLRTLPIMMCSASSEEIGEALQSGADFFVSKPYRRSDIIGNIYRFLRVR